jgi:hypothetical protein
MTFDKRVKEMTAKEIIMSMINGLRKRYYRVNMVTFGYINKEDGKTICYGCAATHTITEIHGIPFDKTNIYGFSLRAKFVSSTFEFLNKFEVAIDYLRKGCIQTYNELATDIGIATIDNIKDIPYLSSNFTEDDLQEYVKLAEMNG